MEIVVKHTITLDPAVIDLLKGFAGNGQAPVKEMTASPAKNSKASTKTEAPKDTAGENGSSESAAPASTAGASKEAISFTDIRQLYLEKKEAGKQDAVKKILDEYGVKKLSEFKPDQFAEVYSKIKAA